MLTFSACRDTPPQPNPANIIQKTNTERSNTSTYSLGREFAQLMYTAHQEAFKETGEFCKTVETFLYNPHKESLQNTKQQWQTANSSYLISDIAHWLPLSHEFHWFKQLPHHINAWPVQAGYIDYLNAYPYSGIVNDISLDIDKTQIRRQQGLTDKSDIILGFHAIEFLLWGEDLSLSSSGHRPASDYSAVSNLTEQQSQQGLKLNDVANNRRRKLLPILCSALQEDLQSLTNAWSVDHGSIALFLQSLTSEQQQITVLQTIRNFIGNALLEKQLHAIVQGNIDDGDQSPFSDTSRIALNAQIKSLALMLTGTSNEQPIDNNSDTQTQSSPTTFGLLNLLLNSDQQQNQHLADLFNQLNVLVLQLPDSFEIMKNETAKDQYLPTIQALINTLQELNTLISARIKFLGKQTTE